MNSTSESKPSPNRTSRGLGAPQFDLRTMMLVIFCISGVLAVHVRFGALAASAVTLGILAIAAHVAANAIGTKLRDQRGDEGERRVRPQVEHAKPLEATDFAPTTRLSSRTRNGWLALIATSIGAVVSMAGGVALFSFVLGENARLNLLLVGGGAIGVLGGIAAFGAFSFFRVFSSAVTQAVRESKRK